MKPTIDQVAKRFRPISGCVMSTFVEYDLLTDDNTVWHNIWSNPKVGDIDDLENVIGQMAGEAHLAVMIAYGRVRGYKMIEPKEEK